MKARTKLQKQVIALSIDFPNISEEQKEYVQETGFKHFVYVTKKHSTCMTCTHKWKTKLSPNSMYVKLMIQECPSCGRVLHPMDGRKRTDSDTGYITKLDVYKKEFQLVRIFFFRRSIKAGEKPYWHITEVIQHWIRARDGKNVVVAQQSSGFNSYYSNGSAWQFGSWEIRIDQNKFYVNDKMYFPKRKILGILKRNGFKHKFHLIHPSWFFQLLLKEQRFETILKLKQEALITHFDSHKEKIEEYWPSIRICFRNNYQVTPVRDWFDHIRLLIHFGKDILSPKYICPKDFNKDHQRLIAKRQIEIDTENLAKQKAEIKKDNKKYRKKIKNFLDIKLEDGDLNIKVIPSVQEIYNEGKILKHCIFNNSYYEDKNSLLLSARIKTKRIETIEFSLTSMKIIQARGLGNKATKYHKQITKLVNQNTKLIKKALKAS